MSELAKELIKNMQKAGIKYEIKQILLNIFYPNVIFVNDQYPDHIIKAAIELSNLFQKELEDVVESENTTNS